MNKFTDRQYMALKERRKAIGTFLAEKNIPLVCCPCCGYPTLTERAAYDICTFCDWEDDGQDDSNAHQIVGGPNGKLSLTEGRAIFEEELVAAEKKANRVRLIDPAILTGRIIAELKNREDFSEHFSEDTTEIVLAKDGMFSLFEILLQ